MTAPASPTANLSIIRWFWMTAPALLLLASFEQLMSAICSTIDQGRPNARKASCSLCQNIPT